MEGGVGLVAEDDEGVFGVAGDEGGVGGVGGEVEDVVVAEFGFDVGEGEAVVFGDAGGGLERLDRFDFAGGEGKALEVDRFAARDRDGGGVITDRTGEDFGCVVGLGGEVGEGLGGDVVDGVALGEPLGAVVEGGEGDVAQLGVGGVDEGLGMGLGEVGFEGFDQPVVEFLGDRFGVAGGVLEDGTVVFDGDVEFFAFDWDGAAEGWRVGGGDDQFEAVFGDERGDDDGVEFGQFAA